MTEWLRETALGDDFLPSPSCPKLWAADSVDAEAQARAEALGADEATAHRTPKAQADEQTLTLSDLGRPHQGSET